MGVYYATYIGPYIEALIEEKERDVPIKINSEGKKFSVGVNFDPNNGKILKDSKKKITEKIYPSPYIQDDPDLEEDMFWSPPYSGSDLTKIFLLNKDDEKYTCETLHPEDPPLEINKDIDSKKIIRDFNKEFKKYLEYYKSQNYTIKVKFGIVPYAS